MRRHPQHPMPMPMPMPTPMPMPMPMPWHRRVILGALVVALGTAVVLSASAVAAQTHRNDDVANTRTLLESMRGTAPVPCAFAMTVVEGNNGWGRGGDDGSAIDSSVSALRAWVSEGLTDPAAVPMLTAALAPGDACVRQTAARLLGRSHNATAVRALATAIRDPDPSTRELAALGLGLSEDPAGYDPLVSALSDTAATVRAASATALGRLGDHRATAVLVPLLSRDRAPAVRRAVAYALGSLD